MFKNRKHIIHLILLVTLLSHSLVGISDSIKVLYLGNSHTFWHQLPQLTANLALANGDTIIFESNTPGGCTLGHPSNGHLFNSTSRALIDSLNWDYVVLQEHSLFAVIDHYKNTFTYPSALALDSLIKENYECTRTILQTIWGKKQGGQHCINSYCSIDFDDFSHMQDSLTANYLQIGNTISSIIAPTGVAWQQSIKNGNPIELFDPDESHPSLAGHYLTACVYYAIMFKKSPQGIPYYGGLTQSDAIYLQQIADLVVFSNPELWNMYPEIPVAEFEYSQNDNTIYCIDLSTNAESYLWDFGDDITDTTQNPSHTYTSSGTFLIKQKVGNYCLYDESYQTVDIIITDLNEGDKMLNNVKIYNERNFTNISISWNNIIKKIKVYGIDGTIVYDNNSIHNNLFSFNIENLHKGLYIISIDDGRSLQTRKFIK